MRDGGAAFPAVEYMAERGMSLLDYYVGACACGHLGDVWAPDMDSEAWAKHIFALARALIAERERQP
jgi:hypothetical protein